MKKTLLTLALVAVSASVFAQGTVNFSNASTTPGLAGGKNVTFGSTAALYNPLLVNGANVSSNYAGVNLSSLRVQLYYGSGTDINTYTPVDTAGFGVSTFKGSTSTTAGSWFTKTATLSGVAVGGATSLFVVAWDSSLSANALSTQARAGLWGYSGIFAYTVPSGTPAPSEFNMANLQTFTIGIIPEPSSFALAGLGMASLLIFRRRK